MPSLSERMSLLQAYYETLLDDMEKMEDYCKETTKLQTKMVSIEKQQAKLNGDHEDIAVLKERISNMKKQLKDIIDMLTEMSDEMKAMKKEFKRYPEMEDTYVSMKGTIIKYIIVAAITAILTVLATYGISKL